MPCLGYIKRRGDFFEDKRAQPYVFFFGAPLCFSMGFSKCPFSPFFFFLRSPFLPEGLFFPFFLGNFLILLLLRCCKPLFFIKIKSALRTPFFIFFEFALFFSKGSFLNAPFFALFFSCPSFDVA